MLGCDFYNNLVNDLKATKFRLELQKVFGLETGSLTEINLSDRNGGQNLLLIHLIPGAISPAR